MSQGDRSPWEYHNRTEKYFIFEGWLEGFSEEDPKGLMDGHIRADNQEQALGMLKRIGLFKWLSLRFICTKHNPWNSSISSNALHQGEWIGESYDGDVDHYKCRNCGQEFSVGH